MGYKELFNGYKAMSSEEIKRNEQLRLSKLKEDNPEKYNREIEKRNKI
ncbi:hypothetical protein [Bacillus changyiensis]|nr:hypothetical protein [Bacillus changyiensis]MDA1476979.1 hypothetical protein [Bacillus changyiensis]